MDAFLTEWLGTILWIGAALLITGVTAFFLTRYTREKTRLMKETDDRAAERFEAAMTKAFEKGKMDGLSKAGTGFSPPPADSPASDSVASAGSFLGVQAPPASPAALPLQTSGGKVAAAVEQLETAGLVERVEDRLVLTEDLPPAQLLTLKGGKRALIVPPNTSFDLIERHRKEADFLVLFPGAGAPLVCRDISEFIADTLFNM